VGPRGKRRPSSHADATEGFGDLSKNAFSRRRVVVGSLVRRVCGVVWCECGVCSGGGSGVWRGLRPIWMSH
jgi:hypothetical protein